MQCFRLEGKNIVFNETNTNIHQNNSSFYLVEFIKLLKKIVLCYNMMIATEIQMPDDENVIRDYLLFNYLKNDDIRREIELTNYIFDREVPEDNNEGRTDIKIQTIQSFIETKAYYIIECKRLNNRNLRGSSGLNSEYIRNGIFRFVGEKYSSYCGVNGMMGFIVEDIDIEGNTDNLNYVNEQYFPETNTEQGLQKVDCVEGYEYIYKSRHKTLSGNNLILYHLMLDFSDNIT